MCSLLARAFFEKAEHEVSIVSIFGESEPFFPLPREVSLFYLFMKRHRCRYVIPVIIYRLRNIIKTVKPDVVVTVNIDSTLCLYSVAALWRMNAKNIVWEHLDVNSHLPSRRFVRALAARRADAVVTLTERDVANWRQRFRLRASIMAIPNPSPYPPKPDANQGRDSRVVLAAGHLIHRKGFDLLVQAWDEITPAVRKGWRLRLVGSGEDGLREEEHAIRKLAAGLRASDTIDFVGQKEDMAGEYESAGLFVLSSRKEGLPMVLLEAMSFGLPVVAFDCKTGPAEIVVDGRTGLLAPPEDVHSLSHAMSRMMADTAFRAECARHALRRSRNYAVEPILRRWEDLFASLSPAKAERAAE